MTTTAERPFTTWTFDKYCETMEWNPTSEVELAVVSAEQPASADLTLVGVFGPPKKEGEEEEKDDDDEPAPLVLSPAAQTLNEETLGDGLTALAANDKSFAAGSSAGATTAPLTIMTTASPSSEGGSSQMKRYMLLGMGPDDGKPLDAATARKIGAAVAAACHDQKKIGTCQVILPSADAAIYSPTTFGQHFATAFYTGLYADNRYRTGKNVEVKAQGLTQVQLVVPNTTEDWTAAIATAQPFAKATTLARDIVNAPHNVLNSKSLADTARRVAEQSKDGCISCEILGAAECEARGMGAYLGTARGSETEPQFIHLTYKPTSGEIKKKVGCVGKGLLFDTGGYNIKVMMMEKMKFDCGGAAAVLGAARAIGELQPPGVEAHFIVAACENMINAKAMVPSDVLTASNGKTIEVLNTDAEGRLTLADALVFADKECGCDSIIELSTLTGACMISLGNQICGLFTDNDELAEALSDISKETGDKSWRMPIAKEYAEQLKSKIADISNLGDRFGGAITAALFLTEFVDKKKPYAHLDIAGPVWSDKTGATGFGAKLVAEWVRRQGE